MRASSERAFTLLEIMLTIAVVGMAVVPVLLIREQATRQSYQARDANLARTLARELLTELEFREPEGLGGRFEKYPTFEYEIQVEEVDLVTGDEEDDSNDPYDTGSGDGAAFGRSDLVDPNEQEERIQPVRRVTLNLTYPDLKGDGPDARSTLVIQTVLPPLPQKDDTFGQRAGAKSPP